MSRVKLEPGENYTLDQEDFVAGRLPHQKRAALKAKKVRSYIASHPHCTTLELNVKFGRSSGIDWLWRRSLIKNDGMGGWVVVPL